MNKFVIAQIFGIIGIIFSVLSMQAKTKKNIMIMLFCLNIASALNFAFLDSVSGSLICFFGAFETVVNYLFDRRGRKVPGLVIVFYVIVNMVLGVSAYKSPLDLIPIVCSLLFCATVCVSKESTIRKLMFGNQTAWLIYDLVVKAYMFSVSNILTLISIVISMFRFGDFKKALPKKTPKRKAA